MTAKRFLDYSANARDLLIWRQADWTSTSNAAPNGDTAASLSTTSSPGAMWMADTFTLPDGSGSEVRTLEFWVNVSAGAASRFVAQVGTADFGTSSLARQWYVFLDASERVLARWFNTTAGAYLEAQTSVLSAGWHHIVAEFNCGSSRSINLYVDAVSDGSDNTTSGTAIGPTSGVYVLSVGNAGGANEMTDQFAKVAWYERALTAAEMTDHYLAMVAS